MAVSTHKERQKSFCNLLQEVRQFVIRPDVDVALHGSFCFIHFKGDGHGCMDDVLLPIRRVELGISAVITDAAAEVAAVARTKDIDAIARIVAIECHSCMCASLVVHLIRLDGNGLRGREVEITRLAALLLEDDGIGLTVGVCDDGSGAKIHLAHIARDVDVLDSLFGDRGFGFLGAGRPAFKTVERPLDGRSLTIESFSHKAQVLIRSKEGVSGSASVHIGSISLGIEVR